MSSRSSAPKPSSSSSLSLSSSSFALIAAGADIFIFFISSRVSSFGPDDDVDFLLSIPIFSPPILPSSSSSPMASKSSAPNPTLAPCSVSSVSGKFSRPSLPKPKSVPSNPPLVSPPPFVPFVELGAMVSGEVVGAVDIAVVGVVFNVIFFSNLCCFSLESESSRFTSGRASPPSCGLHRAPILVCIYVYTMKEKGINDLNC
mmetsp:Transcript_27563/g.44391  ORF Transcript_27563/g.44391 Transcript_27563/m.44391 type:complete len:202 (+) Transcript_27563:171-776(+)